MDSAGQLQLAIVDDDDSVRKSLRRILDSSGYRTCAFASGEEFLSSGHDGCFDCLILDIRMPGMTGFELQQKLEASGSTMPIIFVTADPDPCVQFNNNRRKAPVLRKPFEAATLITAIRAATIG